MDVLIKTDGATSSVTGDTDEGTEFVDSWLLGVLSVEDVGRLTITSEVVRDFTGAASERGLSVEVLDA